jgi:hypothetical protein
MSKTKSTRRTKAPDALKEAAVAYRSAAPADVCYLLKTPEDKGWEEFRDQCRRQMERPLALRIKYGFVRPLNQTQNESGCRVFETMADYRSWCENNLPAYLGYKRPSSK